MLVITKRRKEGTIAEHTIYAIDDTALVPSPSLRPFVTEAVSTAALSHFL